MTTCPFCTLSADRMRAAGKLAFVLRDSFPISPGHTLIIPRRHIGSWFDATPEERTEMLQLIDAQKVELDRDLKPDAYNIGVNDGPMAGQTVPHLHMHLIPRFRGDVTDPRGGVRWLIPAKAAYWSDGI
jgi:diadenosine tetraphosphate (Ap4A) HIT family hydrolase